MKCSVNENIFNIEDLIQLNSRKMHFVSGEQLYKNFAFNKPFPALYENVMTSGKCSNT